MKHNHWFFLLYTEGCPRCKVRQLRYGFRLDPEGYARAIEAVMRNRGGLFTQLERKWILEQVGEL